MKTYQWARWTIWAIWPRLYKTSVIWFATILDAYTSKWIQDTMEGLYPLILKYVSKLSICLNRDSYNSFMSHFQYYSQERCIYKSVPVIDRKRKTDQNRSSILFSIVIVNGLTSCCLTGRLHWRQSFRSAWVRNRHLEISNTIACICGYIFSVSLLSKNDFVIFQPQLV